MNTTIERMCPLYGDDSCYKSEIDCTCETCPLSNSVEVMKKEKGIDIDMLTVKDKVEQFKRDCKSNDYYTKAIMECNERIEELDLQLTGMTSGSSDTPKCENTSNPYKENKLGLLVLQDQVIKERDEYINKINNVSSKLMRITDPIDRQMVNDLLIEKKYYLSMVDKYHYNDKSAMYRHLNKVIAKIV